MAEPVPVDTNVLIRFLANNREALSPAARGLLEQASRGEVVLLLLPSTISEVVFVLAGAVYQSSRADIARVLNTLLALPLVIRDRAVVESAVELFAEHHADWDDCLLSAYAINLAQGAVVSFDRGLDRIPGITRREPARPN